MTNWQTPPRGRRTPGYLPNPFSKLERCRTAIQEAPKGKIRETLQVAFSALEDLIREQYALNTALWDGYQSLPSRHGYTHKGGTDNIAASVAPPNIVVGGDSVIGDPTQGFAAGSHSHGIDLTDAVDPETDVRGVPNPPFRTLADQLRYLQTQSNLSYALRPFPANQWR